ncbi:MAG: STAS domain-containing protein [Thiotrichales bacterium]
MTGLTIETSHLGERAILRLRGSLDAATSKDLDHITRTLAGGEARHIALDCSELAYLTSAGLKAILEAFLAIRPHGSMLVVATHDPENMLRFVGMDRLLPVCSVLPTEWSEGRARNPD